MEARRWFRSGDRASAAGSYRMGLQTGMGCLKVDLCNLGNSKACWQLHSAQPRAARARGFLRDANTELSSVERVRSLAGQLPRSSIGR